MRTNPFSLLVFFVILGIGGFFAFLASPFSNALSTAILAITVVVALIVSSMIKVASQWDRAIVLRLGRFRALKGPGLFQIIPVVEPIPTGLTSVSSRPRLRLSEP